MSKKNRSGGSSSPTVADAVEDQRAPGAQHLAFRRGNVVFSRAAYHWSENQSCWLCGQASEWDDPDPCLATLPGIRAACCGHGRHRGYLIATDGERRQFSARRVREILKGPMPEHDAIRALITLELSK